MPPLTYIHASEAARTTAGGRAVDGGIFTPPQAVNGLIPETSAHGCRCRYKAFPSSNAGGGRIVFSSPSENNYSQINF